ncbi:MAG: META domain-containing protein [Chloroflexi bacterium]|nr:META domain-containing protein [Chloroflexota bacterium]
MGTQQRAALGGFFAVAIFVGISILATTWGSQVAASVPTSRGPAATAVALEMSQAREQRIELAEKAVRNGRYELPGIGAFEMQDGNFQEKYGEGATQVKRAGVVAVAFGDVDGDIVEDAAVVLWANTGGSGTFIYLAAVLNKDGKGQQAGAQLLGDRVQIKSLTVNSGKITVEVLAQGARDPMVSPSLLTEQEYGLQGGTLKKLTPAVPAATPASRPIQEPSPQPAQAAPSGLIGTVWAWQRFVDSGEKGSFLVPYPAAFRLELLSDGRFHFQADCNRGSGGYTLEGSRLALKAGPMTLAACGQGSRYSQFVGMLGQVATYMLKGDGLSLKLERDGGEMVFSKLNSVTGRIVGPAGDTAPGGGTAEVMVVNSAGAPIGGSVVKAQLPMQFEAPFKPANIDPSTTYVLEVTIKDAQKNVVFRNARPYQVLTQGNPTYHLEVEVERVR